MDDKKNKKKYDKPEANVIEYNDDDVILTSLEQDSNPGWTGEYWG